jgi:hypothetical protein
MVTGLATWGLFVAFVIHDGEEWFTMPGWGARNADRLRRIYPRIPPWLLRRLDPPAFQARLAIALMGVIFLAAAIDGARTGGRSVFYQIVLIGFGVHSVFHLGQAVLARGYAPGVISAVLVVAPFSLWAWRQLESAGSVGADSTGTVVLAVVLIVPVIVGINLAAVALTKPGIRRRTR